jgi:hypothetical protein
VLEIVVELQHGLNFSFGFLLDLSGQLFNFFLMIFFLLDECANLGS